MTAQNLSANLTLQSSIEAEIISARVLVNTFEDTDLSISTTNRYQFEQLLETIQKVEQLDFKEKNTLAQDIYSVLDPIRRNLSLKNKRIYYERLHFQISQEEALWKKNALITALLASIIFAIWLSINTAIFLMLPPSLYLLGFEIILTLNLFLIKGLRNEDEKKDSIETLIFYNHVELHKQIAWQLNLISLKFYNPAYDLDKRTKENIKRIIELIANIFFIDNPSDAFKAAKNLSNYKAYLAQILAYILTDPEIKQKLWLFNTFIGRFLISQILNRIILTEEEKTEFIPILEFFAHKMGLDYENLQNIFQNKKWGELFNLIFI